MIGSDQRLVVFAPNPDALPEWILDREAFIWETGKDWPSLSAMTCNPAVGDTSRPLYLVRQNLVESPGGGAGGVSAEPTETEVSALARAREANEFAVVTARLEHCDAQHRRRPSFVAVDFSRVGDAQGATQVMNGVRAP